MRNNVAAGLAIVTRWGIQYQEQIFNILDAGSSGKRRVATVRVDRVSRQVWDAQYGFTEERRNARYFKPLLDSLEDQPAVVGVYVGDLGFIDSLSKIKDERVRPLYNPRREDHPRLLTPKQMDAGVRLNALHTPRNLTEAKREVVIWDPVLMEFGGFSVRRYLLETFGATLIS